MRLLYVLAACILAVVTAGADGATAGVLIKVDKSAQRMTVSVDGEERHSWAVSTGLPRYSTPVGTYTPFRLEEDHFSKEWDDAPMPHSIFFTGRGHAIHGSDATRRLGSPASHGCIRLSRTNAATLFDLVRREGLSNTRVVVTGDEVAALARKRPHARLAARRTRPATAMAGHAAGVRGGGALVQGGASYPYAVPAPPLYVPFYYGRYGGYGYGW
jgi:hypothetical protein